MAPKKNKGDKKGKDGGGKDDANAPPPEANESTKLENLTFLNEQLKKQLTESQNEYDFLRDNSNKFRNEFETKIEEQQEIILFLEKTIADMRRKQSNLEETIRNDHAKYKEYQTSKEDEITKLKSDYSTEIGQWKDKVVTLENEMLSITDFKEQKENIEKEVSKIQESLLQEKRERQNREAFLERRFLSERERLKKEMLNKIRETKLRLLAMTQDQLHTTTKRTIMENEQMTIELQYQSKETEKLLQTQKQQQNLCSKLKRQIELHKKTEKMLATRTYFLQKLVDQLHAEIKKKDEKLQHSHNSFLNNHDNDASHSTQIHSTAKHRIRRNRSKNANVNWNDVDIRDSPQYQTEVEKAEQRGIKKSQVEIKKLRQQTKSLNKQLNEARRTYERFLNLQDETVTFVWSCIEEVRNDLMTESSTEELNQDSIAKGKLAVKPFNKLTRTEQLVILERLFSKLNSSQNENDILMYQTPSEKVLAL